MEGFFSFLLSILGLWFAFAFLVWVHGIHKHVKELKQRTIPAAGWFAGFKQQGEEVVYYPLVSWVIDLEGLGNVKGIVLYGKGKGEMAFCDSQPNFIGYYFKPEK